jgi:hypothetical protein
VRVGGGGVWNVIQQFDGETRRTKRPNERSRMDIKETGWEEVNWTDLVQDWGN